MNRLLIILFLFFTTKVVQGTECVITTFQHEFIEFQLCQNYSNYNETTTLLYKARAKQLNRFIADLVETRQLKKKKFSIQIYDPRLTYNYIYVSQSKANYGIDCSGFLSFEEIAQIVFYFAQPEWRSFMYDPGKVKNQGLTRQKFLNIINKYALPDISSYISDSNRVWQLDNISLTYNNDNIYYSSEGQLLTYKPTSNLPVKIHDRFLFFQADSIFVCQDNTTILSFKIPEVIEQDYSINRYNKWVNIGLGAANFLYSYCYDKNKFYDLTVKKNGR